MFKINGVEFKFHDEYTKFPREKITTSVRKEYWEEYKSFMKSINEEYSRGFDIMIQMLGENQEFLNEFMERIKKY